MKCSSCGADITDGSKFCEFCGSQISVEMQKEQELLNKGGCPKCGSTNTTFSREKMGEVKGKSSTHVIRKTIGVCKDCGYTWDSQTGEAPKGQRKTWLWVLGWIFIFPVPLAILLLRPSCKLSKGVKYGIIAVAALIYILWMSTGFTKDKAQESSMDNTVIEQEAETDNTAVVDEEKEVQENIAVEETEDMIEEVNKGVETTSDSNYISPEDFLLLANIVLEENFGTDHYSTSYEDGIVSICVWKEAVSEGAAAIALGNTDLIGDWDTMKESLQGMSKSITDTYKETTGREDAIMVNVLNDTNKDLTLLTFVGETCVYDCVDEYR